MNAKIFGAVALTDDLIMTVRTESNCTSVCMAVYSISSRSQRLHLLWPFSAPPAIFPASQEIFGLDSSTNYYYCDPSADRITRIWFGAGPNMFDVAISTHQIVKLLPPPLEEYKTLKWNEWGPTCTRWFRNHSQAFYPSASGSWIYFSHYIQELIAMHNIIPKPIPCPDAAVIFCDFNPRILRRNCSLSTPIETNDQQNVQSEKISTESKTEVESVVTTNLLYQRVVTEEWVLQSSAFTEDVRSCLPFRVFIRKKVDDWKRCPIMGADPIAIFSVSSLVILSNQSFLLTAETLINLGERLF